MLKILTFATALAMTASAALADPAEISTISGLPGVESLLYDADRGVYYATLQAGEEPGDGSVVTISPEGAVGNPVATGLENPKGMGLVNDRLFVGDMSNIVEINLANGAVTRYAAEGAQFLNDVAIDDDGDVFVSDMFSSAIYRVSNGDVSLWMRNPDLENPNGLLFVDGDLYVAAWGPFDDGNPIEAPNGRILRIFHI